MKERFVAVLPEKFLEHLMPCYNNQWNGEVGHVFEVPSCSMFTTYER